MGGTVVMAEDDEPAIDEDDEDLSVSSISGKDREGQESPMTKAPKTPAKRGRKAASGLTVDLKGAEKIIRPRFIRPKKVPATNDQKRRDARKPNADDDSQENFDLDALSGSESEDDALPPMVKVGKIAKKGMRNGKAILTITPRQHTDGLKGKKALESSLTNQRQRYHTHAASGALHSASDMDGEYFDLDAINATDDSDNTKPAVKPPLSATSLPKVRLNGAASEQNTVYKSRLIKRKPARTPTTQRCQTVDTVRRDDDSSTPTSHIGRHKSPLPMDLEPCPPVYSTPKRRPQIAPRRKSHLQDTDCIGDPSGSPASTSSSPRLLRALSTLSMSSPPASAKGMPSSRRAVTQEQEEVIEIMDTSDDDVIVP